MSYQIESPESHEILQTDRKELWCCVWRIMKHISTQQGQVKKNTFLITAMNCWSSLLVGICTVHTNTHAPKSYQLPATIVGQWADVLQQFRISTFWLKYVGDDWFSFWENLMDVSSWMTTDIIGVTRENMISCIHVSCLYSESQLKLQSLSFMILVSHVAADCEETTLVSEEQTNSLVDLFAGSLLLPNGDLYYLVSINVR